MLRGVQNSNRSRIFSISMRSGRTGGCRTLSVTNLTFFAVGLVLGFAVTMCVQSLSNVPPSTSSVSRTCLRSRSRRVVQDARSKESHASSFRTFHNLILVGVMTAQKYVDSRAWTVWRSWAQTMPGRVVFFVAENTKSRHAELPLIQLAGVDDSYPPQKKSYMMLRWMADHHLEDFQWFLRTDDDVYVRGDKLEILLRSLNSSKPWYLGQAGLGTPEEYGQLSLGQDDNYCMGGPGVVFSRETLRSIRPHIPSCLSNMYTTHEDVEVGRCVRKFAGVACSWSYEMQTIFYNNRSGYEAYSGDLNVAEVLQAITLHPVKKPVAMKRLHNFARKLKTADLRFRSLQLSRDVLASMKELAKLAKSLDWKEFEKFTELGHSPSLSRYVPGSEGELLHWDFLSPNILFCSGVVNCPRHNSPTYLRYAVSDAVRQVVDTMNRYARQRGRVLIFQDVLYGYKRVDPVHGADYIVDMLLLYRKFKGRKVTVPVRRHAYLQQTFGNLEIVDAFSWRRIQKEFFAVKQAKTYKKQMTEHSEDNEDYPVSYSGGSASLNAGVLGSSEPAKDATLEPVNMVVPIAGRGEAFRRFLTHFEQTCFGNSTAAGPVSLIVVLFPREKEDDANIIRSLMGVLKVKYPERNVHLLEISDKEFSRGLALAKGAAFLPPESLLFFTDVDILFDEYALHRIRQNTVRGVQVNYPIVFSEYAPAVSGGRSGNAGEVSFQYHSRSGYFRHFGYGLVSLYKSDLDLAGGVETGISGWGLEDVNLFEKCFRKGNFTVFRAPEPSLVHVYHPVICDKDLSPAQYEMCLGSRAQSYASIDFLADSVLSDQRYASLFRRKDKL